jgi:hypothetical protein
MGKAKTPGWVLDIIEPQTGLSFKEREILDRRLLGKTAVDYIREKLAVHGYLAGINEPEEETELWTDILTVYEPGDQAIILTGLLGRDFNVTWSPYLDKFEVQDRSQGFLRSFLCTRAQVLSHRTEEPQGERWR